MLALGLLWAEYKIVELVLKRQLGLRMGYVQSAVCVVVALYGVAAILAAATTNDPTPAGVPETVLLLICVLGEAFFLANVVLTYKEDRKVEKPAVAVGKGQSARPAFSPPVPAKPVRSSDWRSPAAVFGIAAGFFVAMGLVMTKVGFLGSQVPLPGEAPRTQVPAGYLWVSTALPFAIFALIYLALERGSGRVFAETPTRIHFVCTLLAVGEAIHVYLGWATTWANPSGLDDPVSFSGTWAFGILAVGCFTWNLITSKRMADAYA